MNRYNKWLNIYGDKTGWLKGKLTVYSVSRGFLSAKFSVGSDQPTVDDVLYKNRANVARKKEAETRVHGF